IARACEIGGEGWVGSDGVFLETDHAADLVVNGDTLVDRIFFDVPGEAGATVKHRSCEFLRRAVGNAVGLAVVYAIETTVRPPAEKFAWAGRVNEMDPAVAWRGRDPADRG